MTDDHFKKQVREIFAKYTSSDELEDAVLRLWLRNKTSRDQNVVLDRILRDAENNEAKGPDRYFFWLNEEV